MNWRRALSRQFPTRFKYKNGSEIPPREFFGGPAFQCGQVGITVAPGGTGKSALTIAEALSLANGPYFFNEGINANVKVWLINAEDDQSELERRVIAAFESKFLETNKVETNLYIDHLHREEIAIVTSGKNGVAINQDVYNNLKAKIHQEQIKVVIIDPFIMTHSINENDNIGIDIVVRAWKSLAHEMKIAIHLVHHTRKEGRGEITAESARGATSLHDAARYVRTLNRVSADQLIAEGIDADQHIVRVDERKSNYVRLQGPFFFKIDNYQIDNGDNVAVAAIANALSMKQRSTSTKQRSIRKPIVGFPELSQSDLEDLAKSTDDEFFRSKFDDRKSFAHAIRKKFGLQFPAARDWVAKTITQMKDSNLIEERQAPYGGRASMLLKRPGYEFPSKRPSPGSGKQIVPDATN